jgi:Domain of unknown function (DUF4337)
MTFKQFTKSEKFEKYVALSTSIIAVSLALSSILSNQAGDDLLIYRAKANNEWSRFQSKSIKENLFEVQLQELSLDVEDENYSENHRQKIKKSIAFFEKEITRYVKEKNEIRHDAELHEKICSKAEAKGNILDLAEGFYQIAIILSAVSLIARVGLLWIFSMLLGMAGMITSAVAFMMP